jgi:hypothetical protein
MTRPRRISLAFTSYHSSGVPLSPLGVGTALCSALRIDCSFATTERPAAPPEHLPREFALCFGRADSPWCIMMKRSNTAMMGGCGLWLWCVGFHADALQHIYIYTYNTNILEACGCNAVHPPPQSPPDLRAHASLHTTKINGSST